MTRRCHRLIAILIALTLYPGVKASAMSVYDLNPHEWPRPIIPTVIDGSNSAVYITNSNTQGDGLLGTGVDNFRVGQRTQLHLGYTPDAIASEKVELGVSGDMWVEGLVRLGKDATYYEYGLPNAATAQRVELSVGDTFRVLDGGDIVVNGASDDVGNDGNYLHSVINAGHAVMNGGTLTLEDFAELNVDALSILKGGKLVLNSGLPPEDEEEGETTDWIFKGIDVSGGVSVGIGGALFSGGAGGVIQMAGQSVTVDKGGLLDTSRGDILIWDGSADIFGTYRAGFDKNTGLTTSLETPDGVIRFESSSAIALSRDLQRLLNRHPDTPMTQGANVIARGDDIEFVDGLPTLETGMGTYNLATKQDELDTNQTILYVEPTANRVYGNASEVDREQFRVNMKNIWKPGAMRRDQSDNIYNLTALETPSVVSDGAASGELNKAVLEALTDGRDQSVIGHGYVDQGVFEMYNSAAQWGVNSVAFNTGEEFMAQLDRRVERIGAELDRLGESWTSGGAFASCAAPEAYVDRVWVGGFSRRDEADYSGDSGYKYRPGGIVLGYDREFGRLNLGAAFAHGSGSYTDKTATANNSKIKSYSAGLYGSYHSLCGFFAAAQATYTHLDNKLSDVRGGMRRRADHDSYAWTLGGKLGYDKPLADRIAISPSLGLTRAQATNRSHDESLDNINVIHIGQLRRDSLTVPLDITLAFDVVRRPDALLRLTGNMGYAYDFYDGGLDGEYLYNGLLGATAMDADIRSAGRHRFNAGVGLLFTGSRLDFTARYDYFQRRDQQTHQAKGSVGVKF